MAGHWLVPKHHRHWLPDALHNHDYQQASEGLVNTGKGRRIDRRTLTAVSEYVTDGWPILPLSPAGDRLVAGMSPDNVGTAIEWWSDRPYGIACRIGQRFDILEVPVGLGERLVTHLSQAYRPIAVAHVPEQASWLFLVSPASPLITELRGFQRFVRLRREGWIPLPPTPTTRGRVTWISHGVIPHSLIAQGAAFKLLQSQSVSALTEGAAFALEQLARP